MKRLFIIASLAILAVGCQKTEIQNEVQTPIGFSTETGKLTRAIVNDTKFDATQPFAVYAYSHQWIDEDDDAVKDQGEETIADVMTNVEVISTDPSNDAAPWKTNDLFTYYWPNDPRTNINFYAYSPSHMTAERNTNVNTTADRKLNDLAVMSHSETSGMELRGYVHENMYVDFMVATPVKGSRYAFPNGTNAPSQPAGVVPMTFNHQMTQILFNVTTDKAYPGVTFTVEEITLKNIIKTATYTNTSLTSTGTYANGTWTSESATEINREIINTYTIFPADDEDAEELSNESTATTYESMLTTPVTMIPQKMLKATSQVLAGNDSYKDEAAGQMFMIKYSISGDGVADETVVRHVPFRTTDAEVLNWAPNKKITYTVKIGLNEIYFLPSVADWDDTDENGTEDRGDDKPWGDEFEFAQ